jgi:hypothetical protein
MEARNVNLERKPEILKENESQKCKWKNVSQNDKAKWKQ